ncbi:unnamed protein product [Ectocarpus sp. CCAP 1310/34]|nr:unnamed protein product [Ectocarpus sp. CCAP 1310/34]
MGKCCQMVMGPAGTGKSTYCKIMQEHCQNAKRTVHVVNLDPAAETFEYEVAFDIRDLISLEDAMEELELGPNGGLVYCMEYLLDNMDWLKDELDKFDDDEYIIFDCPGQVELYSHVPVMRNVLDQLKSWNYNVCAVFLLDATFITDPAKFMSGALLSLSAMVQLELPHLNVLTKCDLADRSEVERFLDTENAALISMHYPQAQRGVHFGTAPFNRGERGGEEDEDEDEDEEANVMDDDGSGRGAGGEESADVGTGATTAQREELQPRGRLQVLGAQGGVEGAQRGPLPRLARLTEAISGVLDDYTMVNFLPLDIRDEEDIALVLHHADYIVQYGEDLEPKQPKDDIEMDG